MGSDAWKSWENLHHPPPAQHKTRHRLLEVQARTDSAALSCTPESYSTLLQAETHTHSDKDAHCTAAKLIHVVLNARQNTPYCCDSMVYLMVLN